MATTKIRFTIRKQDDEYQVRKFENNRLHVGATYYTDDLEDAFLTMVALVNELTDNHEYYQVRQTSKNSITVTMA